MIKEVILFWYGDSADASTWSNVPYLMSKELERQGVVVRRVDISPRQLPAKIYNRALRLKFKLSGSSANSDYSFIRTRLFRYLTNRKIAKAVSTWPQADFCLFLCMDFINERHDIPSMVFSDWTYEMLKERKGLIPDRYDCKFIAAQNRVLANAEVVLPLFSTTYDRLCHVSGVNAVYPGFNVVNDMSQKKFTAEEILERKNASDKLLFIGGPHYASGLKLLIEALKHVEDRYKLHVIGMNVNDVPGVDTHDVVFHGYLRKDINKDNETYYNLLSEARVLINPTPLWGAYSSVVEGMFYYTPVIISPYEQFVKEYGENIDFGTYINSSGPEDLGRAISNLLNLSPEQYRAMCERAHNRVKDYTWERYVRFIIEEMQGVKELHDN